MELSAYSDNWVICYKQEKKLLENTLKGFLKYSIIEHIGATSVIYCKTLGTIDLLLSIPRQLDLFTFKNYLAHNGYEEIVNKSSPTSFFMVRRNENKQIIATIRIVEYASHTYNVIKAFKDFLKDSKSNVRKYNEYRENLLQMYGNDYSKYEKGKIDYINSIIKEHFRF